jgi:hypothetical protein
LRGSPLNLDSNKQQILRTYLLGQSSPEDSSRFEERLLADGSFYDELLIAEDDLIDEYLAEELSEAERRNFESHFLLVPERQQKLRFARAFRKYVAFAGNSEAPEASVVVPQKDLGVARPPSKRGLFSFFPVTSPIASYSLMAAMLLLVGGISWAVFNAWKQQQTPPPGSVLAVVLTPGLTREGGEIKRITIPPGTGVVRLQLEIPKNDFNNYRVGVLSVDRTAVWSGNNIQASDQGGTKLINADVPVSSLTSGDYQVKVSGQLPDGTFEDTASYRFRVAR